jgi:hypothetical protein
MLPSVRLYVLLARANSSAVVFRRGPSKRVLLISWNTRNDTFEEGQYFNGHIYERRCDLSPDGKLLLYFAATYRQPYFSWSAVSRPPYLSALALWSKGDGWGGGGHFIDRHEIALNHRPDEMSLADGFRIPSSLRVKSFGPHSGWGEDDPVWSERLRRDGWVSLSKASVAKKVVDPSVWLTLDPPAAWEKAHPESPQRYKLDMRITGIKRLNGPWYRSEYRVLSEAGDTVLPAETDWADWSRSGDLLFSSGARLYRAACDSKLGDPQEIADFSQTQLVKREPPPYALRWPPGV